MEPIDELLQKLNDYQKQAVLDESRAALVNAGVGSGKTTVLTAKVLYLHYLKQASLKDMVVITFTNKAADEIKARLEGCPESLPQNDARHFGVWLGTFHSVAMRMLQTALPVESLGYTPAFTVTDPDELLEMAKGLIAEHNLKIKYTAKLAKRLESYRCGRQLYGVMKAEDDITRLCGLLEQEKKAQNKMDFDDLIQNATQLLKEAGSFAKWVIVDEFQDCDSAQLAFIRALAGDDAHVFAVGDPSQSIYSWRGSKQDVFAEFKKEFNAREFSLPVNYRSSATILEAARSFLKDGAQLTGVREPGCKINIQNCYNAFLEAGALAGKIKKLHADGVPWQDIAVFYRLQIQSKNLTDAFFRAGIPFEVSQRKTLKDIPVLQWLVRLLRAGINPNSRGSLAAALCDPKYGAGLTPAKAKKCTAGGCELFDKITGFAAWAQGGAADKIADYFNLYSYLSPTSAAFAQDKDTADRFLKKLEAHIQENCFDFLPGCADFLNAASLYGAEMLEDAAAPADAVRLMTLHACKGLEFRHVFIIGVNYGLIPLLSAAGDGDEEKRLFFVGITRAKDCLNLSYYTNPEERMMQGESPYLLMIPPQLTQRGEEPRPSEASLQSLRRAVLENRNTEASANTELFESIPQVRPDAPAGDQPRKVRHPKYGEGFITSEDENNYTVVFKNFGQKSFSKDFCPLEFE